MGSKGSWIEMARAGQNSLPIPGDRQQLASPVDVAAVEHERIAIDLRAAGATYGQIATQLHHSDGREFTDEGARQCVKRGMEHTRALTKAEAEEYRELEVRRLDAMFLAIWDRAKSGDIKAIETCLKIIRERAKFLGTYAPTRTSWEGRMTIADEKALDAELIELTKELLLMDPELMEEVLKRTGGQVNLG